jgi:signal transduction histidine kinase
MPKNIFIAPKEKIKENPATQIMQPERNLEKEIHDLVTGKTPTSRAAEREQILRAQKFRALNQLAGGIAHEFNNVIAGVLGSAELAAMDIHDGHPAHDSLKQIVEASRRGRDFLHKVRTFSLRPPVELRAIQLQPVVEETLQLLRSIIPDKVELHSRFSPECPEVPADGAQLQQVVLDLCLHCWQHLHERRGQITLAVEFVHVPGKVSHIISGEHCVRLTVRDDGPGLDAAALGKIFDPFHTRRANAKKVGIELFHAREVIHDHHGEILAESEPGHGLAFHIYLPVSV